MSDRLVAAGTEDNAAEPGAGTFAGMSRCQIPVH